MLNANHWADHAASQTIAQDKRKLSLNLKGNDLLQKMLYTNSEFRFFFTWNGKMIDKNTCQFLDKIFESERIQRLQTREAQGMLSRIMSLTTTEPSDPPFKSGWRRLLLYFTNTHTRSTYKKTDYNNAATCFILIKLLADEEGELLDCKYLSSLKLDSNLLKRCNEDD